MRVLSFALTCSQARYPCRLCNALRQEISLAWQCGIACPQTDERARRHGPEQGGDKETWFLEKVNRSVLKQINERQSILARPNPLEDSCVVVSEQSILASLSDNPPH